MLRLLWLSAFVGAVLLANLFLDTFIRLPWFGLFSIGSIFFAAIFTLRNRLHSYGLPTVYLGIALALLVNMAYGKWVANISFRFLIASFCAILLSELSSTALFQHLRKWSWHKRVLGSNAICIPLDSTAFTLLAFAGSLSLYDMSQIIYADVLGKFVIATAIAYIPGIAPCKATPAL